MILVRFFIVVLAICSSWQIEASANDTDSSPALEFVPMPDAANALIYYKAHDEASVGKWSSKIDEYLQQYSGKSYHGGYIVNCSPDLRSSEDRYCNVDLREFDPCISETKYNYPRAAPCVFLKLDKLLNWTPNPYNSTEDLPTDMPEGLKQHISNVSGREEANSVWVSCEGETPADIEFIGPIKYLPSRGFPTYYFPYKNQEGYLSPLVAVQFEKPRTGIVINIVCKAWAKNISRDGYEHRGAVHFELMVDQ